MLRSTVVVAVVLLVASIVACRKSSTRELTLVAQGMTFTIVEQPDSPNPILRFQPGERVRVTLRNDAAGLLHDFAIPAWNIGINQLRTGETGNVVFTVPNAAGTTAYLCRPHAELMNGLVEVGP